MEPNKEKVACNIPLSKLWQSTSSQISRHLKLRYKYQYFCCIAWETQRKGNSTYLFSFKVSLKLEKMGFLILSMPAIMWPLSHRWMNCKIQKNKLMNIKVMFEIFELIFLHLDLSSYSTQLPFILLPVCYDFFSYSWYSLALLMVLRKSFKFCSAFLWWFCTKINYKYQKILGLYINYKPNCMLEEADSNKRTGTISIYPRK